MASDSTVAGIFNAKYVNTMPLYRIEAEYNRVVINISRQTMSNWVIQCADRYLTVFYDYLHEHLYDYHVIQADETPIQVLKEPERRPQSKSYVWVFRTGEDRGVPIILFNYTPTRKGANAADFLKDAPEGYFLMTDGYKGYNKVPDANRCALLGTHQKVLTKSHS